MPNIVNGSGVQVYTQQELVDIYTAKMKVIYGDDINLSQDTPDGQQMMIVIQMIMDSLDFAKQSNASFDPDQAIGRILDQRVAINGIQRKAGTYTIQPIDIVMSQANTLYGLDQTAEDPYTIKDDAGTKWILMETAVLGTGAHTKNFQSEKIGAVLSMPNTITIPVSIILGVSSVNNSSSYVSIGINEESDVQLHERRRKSVALSSLGYRQSLKAMLNNITGVTYAEVWENNTVSTNEDGQPRNSIWVVVAGNAEDYDIAEAILVKRNAGCTMFGSDKSHTITLPDGSSFTALWDLVVQENLFVKFIVDSIDGTTIPNIAAIKAQLPQMLQPDVNGKVNINQVAAAVRQIDPNSLVTNIGLGSSELGPFVNIAVPESKKNQFVVSSNRIIITPMQLRPSSITGIATGDSRQFIASGGYGTLTWSLTVNGSGGSVSASGLYEAGATPDSVDEVRAMDELGNYVTASIGVV